MNELLDTDNNERIWIIMNELLAIFYQILCNKHKIRIIMNELLPAIFYQILCNKHKFNFDLQDLEDNIFATKCPKQNVIKKFLQQFLRKEII